MIEDIKERNALCTKRRCVISALIFLAATAVCRALDFTSASWAADVMVSPSLSKAAAIASVAVSVAAVAFSGGATVFASVCGKRRTAYFAASLFSAVAVADRTFYVAYSIATNVKTFSADAGAEAYVRVISDALFLVAAYFLTAFAGIRAVDKYGEDSEKSRTLPALVFASVLTAGQTAYQTYVTVRFFATYDDVTGLEKSSIAADYFFILLKYGVITFGAVAVFFTVLRGVFRRIDGK